MNGPLLFDWLPEFPISLPEDELRLLRSLPEWEAVQAVNDEDHAACRRLERKGLVKVQREKDDPCAIRPTWYAGKLPSSAVRPS